MANSLFYRYSCRDFTRQEPTDQMLEQIIRAGMQAPSAMDQRPWEFLVVKSEHGREMLAQASPYTSCCRKAPAVILALANSQRVPQDNAWWLQDMCACIENMLLEAVELKLGSVWLGIYPRMDRVKAVQEGFCLSESLVPVAALPIGYPAGERRVRNKFERERIHWESD